MAKEVATLLLVMFFVLAEALGAGGPAHAHFPQAGPTIRRVNSAGAGNDVDTQVVITGSVFVSTPVVYLGGAPLPPGIASGGASGSGQGP